MPIPHSKTLLQVLMKLITSPRNVNLGWNMQWKRMVAAWWAVLRLQHCWQEFLGRFGKSYGRAWILKLDLWCWMGSLGQQTEFEKPMDSLIAIGSTSFRSNYQTSSWTVIVNPTLHQLSILELVIVTIDFYGRSSTKPHQQVNPLRRPSTLPLSALLVLATGQHVITLWCPVHYLISWRIFSKCPLTPLLCSTQLSVHHCLHSMSISLWLSGSRLWFHLMLSLCLHLTLFSMCLGPP